MVTAAIAMLFKSVPSVLLLAKKVYEVIERKLALAVGKGIVYDHEERAYYKQYKESRIRNAELFAVELQFKNFCHFLSSPVTGLSVSFILSAGMMRLTLSPVFHKSGQAST